MKSYLKALAKVLGIVSPLILVGAGNAATVYFGFVRAVEAHQITIVQKNGAEKTVTLAAGARAFVSGKLVPTRFIKRNSKVQIAVDEHDVCLQIVVDEVPK